VSFDCPAMSGGQADEFGFDFWPDVAGDGHRVLPGFTVTPLARKCRSVGSPAAPKPMKRGRYGNSHGLRTAIPVPA
jgi:hypothetical protein